MRLQSPERAPDVLPSARIERILVLRTAQRREVDWAMRELAVRYPDATMAVLGTRLKALGVFGHYEQIDVDAAWLTPRSVRPHMDRIRRFGPDLVVLCLNNDSFVGYERLSRVMRGLHAPHKLVATYTRRWRRWTHVDFVDGPLPLRWLVNGLLVVLYPLVVVYLLCRPSGPPYRPDPSPRVVPEVPA